MSTVVTKLPLTVGMVNKMTDEHKQPICLMCGRTSPSEGQACSQECIDEFQRIAQKYDLAKQVEEDLRWRDVRNEPGQETERV